MPPRAPTRPSPPAPSAAAAPASNSTSTARAASASPPSGVSSTDSIYTLSASSDPSPLRHHKGMPMADTLNIEGMKYHYDAIVRAVHDGDTCTVDIDLGLNTWVHGEKLRLHRINAPELFGASRVAGAAARDFLSAQINGKASIIATIKDQREKYGRYLAEIWLADAGGQWRNINDLMVQSGQAVYKEY